MKFLKYSFVLFCLVLMVFVSSCKEDEQQPLTQMEILMSHPWISSDFDVRIITGITSLNYDVLNEIEACRTDDQISFYSETRFRALEGSNECTGAPSDGIIFDSTWNLNEGTETLSLDAGYVEQIVAGDNSLPISLADLATDGFLVMDVRELNTERVRLYLEKPVQITISGFSVPGTVIMEVTLIPVN